MFEGSVKLTFAFSAQVCGAVCAVKTGAEAGMTTEKVSDEDSPPVSVAVTLMVSAPGVFGAVPVKVSVAALNVSQDGSAEPFACVAL